MRNRIVNRMAVALVAALLTLGAAAQAGEMRHESSRTIDESFDLGRDADNMLLIVDNINGGIEVRGGAGSTVRIRAVRTNHARDRRALERAESEVSLEMYRDGDELVLRVDGPFRDRYRRDHNNPGYFVEFDIEVEVPAQMALDLSTVNGGDIITRGARGPFDVNNVNGEIDLSGLGSSGDATTVNGEIRLAWDRNPDDSCTFHTVNGDIRTSFAERLHADLKFDTFNGEAYTNFEVHMLSPDIKTDRKRGGSMVRIDKKSRVRAGSGGPELNYKTLNGDIEVREE